MTTDSSVWSEKQLRLASLVIHGGQRPDPSTGAVMPPISLASTYAQESPGVHKGFEYSRSHNPTRYALERCIARLEGSELTERQDVSYGGFAFASGLAAIATTLELLDTTDAEAKTIEQIAAADFVRELKLAIGALATRALVYSRTDAEPKADQLREQIIPLQKQLAVAQELVDKSE
ncbi:MAG: PLP-dependent transferase [Planctomycetes bacterium]|nr:PLP-dependent transferase [Planctomycetota bacterium]